MELTTAFSIDLTLQRVEIARTSRASSMICIDAMIGLGTEFSSEKPPDSGDAMHSGAARMPPGAARAGRPCGGFHGPCGAGTLLKRSVPT